MSFLRSTLFIVHNILEILKLAILTSIFWIILTGLMAPEIVGYWLSIVSSGYLKGFGL